MKDYLNPKKPIGVEPAAGNNVEEVGPCCLDVNTKTADFAKGRFGWLWWFIWMSFGIPLIVGVLVLANIFSGGNDVAGMQGAVISVAVLIVLVFVPVTLYFIRTWQTHLPMRFNRSTRKVYFNHKGTTYTADWDKLRAYIYLQDTVLPNGAVDRDAQVNVEFKRQDGGMQTVPLLGTFSPAWSLYDGAARLWEYIRLYMEEGPEVLPEPVKPGPGPELNWRDWARYHSPFTMFNRMSLLGIVSAPLVFPVKCLMFLSNYPTDVIYSSVARGISMRPWPVELEQPCRCNEKEQGKRDRLAALLKSYTARLEHARGEVNRVEASLLEEYQRWFVEPCLEQWHTESGDSVERVPDGWFRVALADLVALNPACSNGGGQDIPYLPESVLSDSGMLITQTHLEKRPGTDRLAGVRQGDTVISRCITHPDDRGAGFVAFSVDGGEKPQFACAAPGLIVMRGTKVSPEFTYCLARDRRLVEHCRRNLVQGQVAVAALGRFAVPVPSPAILEEFQQQCAGPLMEKIRHAEEEQSRLTKVTARLNGKLPRAGATSPE